MNMKKVAMIVLLAFVGVSIGYLIYKEAGKKPAVLTKKDKPNPSDVKTPPKGDLKEKYVVYYFHGNARCRTCITLERFIKKAVEDNFEKELTSGRLEFKAVNIEEPEGKPYVSEFQLASRTGVVAAYNKEGKLLRHKEIGKIWRLVRNYKAFEDYVVEETENLMMGTN